MSAPLIATSGDAQYWERIRWALNEARAHINLTVETSASREVCAGLGTFAAHIDELLRCEQKRVVSEAFP